MRKRFTAGVLIVAMAVSMTACSNTEGGQEAAAGSAVAESTQEETNETAADTGAETADTGTADTGAADAESAEAAEQGDNGSSEATAAGAGQVTILSYLEDGTAGEASGDKLDALLTEGVSDTALKISVTDQELEEAQDQKLSYAAGVQTLVQFIRVEDGTKEALQKALDQDNETQMELMKEGYASALEFDQEMADMNTDTDGAGDMYYSLQNKVVVKRADDKILSYLREDYSYTGGAHPNTAYVSYNYDPETGKELTLQDVVTDYDGLYEKVVEALQKVYEDNDGNVLFTDYRDTVKSMFYGTESTDAGTEDMSYPAGTLNWVMTKDGIAVIFNQYDIAPYAAGQIAAEIPFETGLIREDYR